MLRHHPLAAPRHTTARLVEVAIVVLLAAMLLVAIPLLARVSAPTDLQPRPRPAPPPIAVV